MAVWSLQSFGLLTFKCCADKGDDSRREDNRQLIMKAHQTDGGQPTAPSSTESLLQLRKAEFISVKRGGDKGAANQEMPSGSFCQEELKWFTGNLLVVLPQRSQRTASWPGSISRPSPPLLHSCPQRLGRAPAGWPGEQTHSADPGSVWITSNFHLFFLLFEFGFCRIFSFLLPPAAASACVVQREDATSRRL